MSNETSYGVMEFVHAAKVEGLPKIVSIQNNYSLLVRTHFESKSYSDSVGRKFKYYLFMCSKLQINRSYAKCYSWEVSLNTYSCNKQHLSLL